MYIVDITRGKKFSKNDMLLGKDSMDAKRKCLNYIIDYAFANLNLYIDRELLDNNFHNDTFSLKNFLSNCYKTYVDDDVLLRMIPNDKEHCLFVKSYNNKKENEPTLFAFTKDQEKNARGLLSFLVNDYLIDMYKNNLEEYENNKISESAIGYSSPIMNCEIISLYKKGKFMEELLETDYSLEQIHQMEHKDIII